MRNFAYNRPPANSVTATVGIKTDSYDNGQFVAKCMEYGILIISVYNFSIYTMYTLQTTHPEILFYIGNEIRGTVKQKNFEKPIQA